MKVGSTTTRTNTDWLADLRTGGVVREQALSDLRAIILAGLPYALANWLSPADPHFDELAEDVVQETLLRVMEHLHTFQHRSLFTTWAHKIAVRVALTELRRMRWKDVSLDAFMEEHGEGMQMAAPASPARSAEQRDIMERVERVIAEELTDKQRLAMMAVNVHGIPLEAVAQQMGTSRNTLYKLLHDARLKLKQRLMREGLTPQDVLAAFAEG